MNEMEKKEMKKGDPSDFYIRKVYIFITFFLRGLRRQQHPQQHLVFIAQELAHPLKTHSYFRTFDNRHRITTAHTLL